VARRRKARPTEPAAPQAEPAESTALVVQADNAPALYEAACRALAAAKTVPEVKDIDDRAAALQHYAHRVLDRELERNAFEIRLSALRRIGQMFDEERKAGRLAKGTRGLGAPKKGGLKKDPPNEVTYEHLLGPQHKQLSDWARKLAKPSDAWFEEFVREAHRCEILSIYGAVHFLKSGRHRQRTNAAAWGGPETWAKPQPDGGQLLPLAKRPRP
jgi:hypothetical protein